MLYNKKIMDRVKTQKNNRRACLCKDDTYDIRCCKAGTQGIGNVTGTKIVKGSFSNGFSDGFEIK